MLSTRLIASLLALIIAAGCKQDTPANPTTDITPTIPGTYKVAKLTANDGMQYDYIQLATTEKNSCFTDLTLTFRENGTLTTNNAPPCNRAVLFPDLTETYTNATWALTGNTLTLSYQEIIVTPITISEKWTVAASGNTLSLTRALDSVEINTGKPIVVTHKMDLVRQ